MNFRQSGIQFIIGLSLGFFLGALSARYYVYLSYINRRNKLCGIVSNINASVPGNVPERVEFEVDEDEYPVLFDLQNRSKAEVGLPFPILRGQLVRSSSHSSSSPSSSKQQYSSVSCLGDINHLSASTLRNCHFQNLCYDFSNNNWLFHEPPDVALPKLFESKLGHFYEFPQPFVTMEHRFGLKTARISPAVTREPIPDSALILNDTFVLHVNWNVAFNLGHDLWEVMFAAYSNLIRFGKTDAVGRAIVLLPHEIKITRNLQRMWNDVGKTITHHHPVSVDLLHPMMRDGGRNEQITTVCVKSLIPAQIIPVFLPASRPYLWGQETLYRDFRKQILRVAGVDPDPQLPSKPLVVLTRKSHSEHAKLGKLHRAIFNLDEVLSDLCRHLPKVKFHVQAWHEMNSWKDQLELLGRTSILISPSGGVSLNGPFLPSGGTVVLMDYLSGPRDKVIFGCSESGESCSSEYPALSYMNTLQDS